MAAERPFDWEMALLVKEMALLVKGWMMNWVCMVLRILYSL